jgi:hypothetical protein
VHDRANTRAARKEEIGNINSILKGSIIYIDAVLVQKSKVRNSLIDRVNTGAAIWMFNSLGFPVPVDR